MESIRIDLKLHGPGYAMLGIYNVNIIKMYSNSGNNEKASEFKKKKEEWAKMQKDDDGKKTGDDDSAQSHLCFGGKEIAEFCVNF